MNRRRAGGVLLAVLAVLSFAAAAATLDTTGEGAGPALGEGGGESRPDPGVLRPPPDLPVDVALQVLAALLAVAVLAAGLVGLYAFYERYGARGLLAAAVGTVIVLGAVALLLGGLQLDRQSPPAGNDDPGRPSVMPGEPGLAGDEQAGVPTASPPVVLALGFALALLVGGLVLVRATGGADYAPPSGDGSSGDVAALGRAAGRAADRIDRGAVVDNEVYRAWREMTERLDVEAPEASTPGEFAEAAVDAGLDPDAVAELTDLFAAVRYGGGEADESRERRAAAALRRIEEAAE